MSSQTEIEIIRRAVSILSVTEESVSRYKAEISRLKDRERYVKEDAYRLGLIGITSSGKSTLVNALLGDMILPAEAAPTTNAIVICRHAKELRAYVHFHDGNVETPEKDNVKACLETFCSERFNPKNRYGVKEIYIESDKIEFPDDLVMIDSPGLDALGHEEHELLTLETLLPTLDFCIYVLSFKDYDEKKLRDVLNTAAHYEKEVIIVMNMSDAVKGSPDHRKSKQNILLEYWRRTEGIINQSDFRDRPKIGMVQMSALYALEGRMADNKDKLSKSGYQQFIDSVKSILSTVKPRIQARRLSQLKSILSQIAKEAGEDAGSHIVPVEVFKYGGIIPEYRKEKMAFINQLDKVDGNLDKIKDNIPDVISENKFQNIKEQVEYEAENVRQALRDYNKAVDKAADALSLEGKELRKQLNGVTISASTNEYATRLTDGTKIVERNIINPIRWLLRQRYKEVPTKEEVGDDEKNRSALDGSISSLKGQILSIRNSFDDTEQKLVRTVNSFEDSYNQRKIKFLEANQYLEIESKLKELANDIKIPEADEQKENSLDFNSSDRTYQCTTDRKILSIIRLAELHIEAIHKNTIEILLGEQGRQSHKVIAGWDENCEAETAYRFFGISMDTSKIKEGYNRITDSHSILHNPTVGALSALSSGRKDWFFLINTTQQGSMMKKMKSLNVSSSIRKNDRIYFVIEDLEERLHCNCIDESVDTAVGLRVFLPTGRRFGILFNHYNPAYNLVAAEVQSTNSFMLTDENALFSNLWKCFPNLRSCTKEHDIEILIKKLKQYGKY